MSDFRMPDFGMPGDLTVEKDSKLGMAVANQTRGPSPVEEEVNRLGQSLLQLNSFLAELRERFKDVLADVPREERVPVLPDSYGHSKVCRAVYDLNNRVLELIIKTREIIEECEL